MELDSTAASTDMVVDESVLKQRYEDVYGYNTPGRGVYAGIGLSF